MRLKNNTNRTPEKEAAIESVKDDSVAMMRIDMPKSIHRIIKEVSNELSLSIDGRFGMKHLIIESIEDLMTKYSEGKGYYQKKVGEASQKRAAEAASKIKNI